MRAYIIHDSPLGTDYWGECRRFQYLSNEFDSYEEALSEGIKEAVKILKEKEDGRM